ncbi:MAG: zinc-dependent metalloprotease [Puniceicoccales bacterium]|jgi:hypothetical protein|nr:zinc-dependent metalloprotease [Puniceicoccales bacterium]
MPLSSDLPPLPPVPPAVPAVPPAMFVSPPVVSRRGSAPPPAMAPPRLVYISPPPPRKKSAGKFFRAVWIAVACVAVVAGAVGTVRLFKKSNPKPAAVAQTQPPPVAPAQKSAESAPKKSVPPPAPKTPPSPPAKAPVKASAKPSAKPSAKKPPPAPAKKTPQPSAPAKLVQKWIENPTKDVNYKYTEADVVDVLILYGPQVRNYWGGHRKLLERINFLLDHTNQDFKRKEKDPKQFGGAIMGKFRLIGLVESDTPTAGNFRDDLHRLRAGKVVAGGRNAQHLRNQLNADLVIYISHHNRRSGGGLSTVRGPWCATDFPTPTIFRHEIQHLMGWKHSDKGNFTMIQRNFRAVAQWKKNPRPDGRVFIQYKGTGNEFDPPKPPPAAPPVVKR